MNGETVRTMLLRNLGRDRLISSLPAAVAPARLRVVDLFAHVCPAGDFTSQLGDVEHARLDGLHFSDPGAWLADWLGPQVVDDTPATVASSFEPER